MSDPYRILGVPPGATDDEVKTAYRELAKKYHPDKYAGSPLADLAGEKMKEINEAYDTVMKERRSRGSSGGGYAGGSTYGYSQASNFSDVRSYVMSGRVADAEQILDGTPQERRDAEWYFLKATVLYKRGWLDEAYNDFSRACSMDPGNLEYRTAFNRVAGQRSGMYGGDDPNVRRYGGCDGCDVCTSLCVANMCCNCCGNGYGC